MTGPAYPLKVSANNRYLVDQNNVPVWLMGDAAWLAVVQVLNADIDTYLSARAALGFNMVLASTIEHYGGYLADGTPTGPFTIDHLPPFTGMTSAGSLNALTWSPCWTNPNESYFQRFDYIVSQAATYGICVLVAALYLGFQPVSTIQEGWWNEVKAASTSDLTSWGTFLGNRYKNSPNIIWVVGADCNPTLDSSVLANMSAFANALVAADPNHLVTAHVGPRGTAGINATDVWTGPPSWLTLNSTYTLPAYTPQFGLNAYAYSPTMPYLNIENWYEYEHSVTMQQLRSEQWYAVLSGHTGYISGTLPVWDYSAPNGQAPTGSPDPDWHKDLRSPGVLNYAHTMRATLPRQWYNLVPDVSHTLVTAGYGSLGSANFVSVAQSADKKLAMAYLPLVVGITVNMAQFPSVTRARWFDPSNAAFTEVAGSPFVNYGSRTITPTGVNSAGDPDWVLILEALDPGMPGSWVDV